ncbi:MAG: hypothetical protein QHI38_13095, partial [Armatimonadota bacterium]|nr:hypothetical protein [Armatimonadota bacterium]
TANNIPLAAGSNTITVTATDAAGNKGTAQIIVTYSPNQNQPPDTTAPTVNITQPTTQGTYTTNTPTVNLAGTATDDVAVVTVTWSSSSGASGNCTGTDNWTANNIPLAAGNNTITITATDAAGNKGTAQIIVTYDPEAPILKITKPTQTAQCARNCDFVYLAGTVHDNSVVAQIAWVNNTTGQSGLCQSDGDSWWTPQIDLLLGENEITVYAQDNAGNTASAQIRVTFIDAVPSSGWQGLDMVSLPIIPDETDPKKEAGFAENYWLTYVTEGNTYAAYPDKLTWLDPADATPGRGFWAYFDADRPTPCGTIPPQTKPAVIQLKKGWNLIGTPFINPVKWSLTTILVRTADGAVKSLRNAANVVPGYAWGWQPDPQDPRTGSYYLVYDSSVMPGVADQLLPWCAYWIKANAACELIIPPP